MKAINIVIVDDHRIFLEGLLALLKTSGDINSVLTATSGEDALKILADHTVDIVITDINMPKMDGMKLTKEIKKKYPKVKILALTMHSEGNMIEVMLKKGISGYVLKDASKEELLNAIKALSKGETFFSEEIQSTLMKSMTSGNKIKPNNLFIELSKREKEILKLVAQEYTQEEIAKKLFISPHTVIFHRRKLLDKFDVKNTAGLIMAAMQKGFLD